MDLENNSSQLDCVLVGDRDTGKSSILSQFKLSDFIIPQYNPLGVDYYTQDILIETKNIRLLVWDFVTAK
jgi:GTPase SAR1 family protein